MILVVGAGFSGAIIARKLAENGHKVKVIDSRNHVAGNCHTEREPKSNIMEHKYGPHIFHTNDTEVWQYINNFTEMVPYIHRVKATSGSRVYSLPINLHSINQFFNKTMGPSEAKAFIENQTLPLTGTSINFESKALSIMGKGLYELLLKNYTEKQWGISASSINANIIKRLPLRYSYDDNYYSHRYQGIPRNGYTNFIENVLSHENIDIELGKKFNSDMKGEYIHTFYSGPIDGYFDYSLGRLPYRTLKFKRSIVEGDFQGCAVMNYCDTTRPFTRITEFKHFTPWENFKNTIYIKEYSESCGPDDIPYYPIHLADKITLLDKYKALALREYGTTFVGRLGTYRYLDMDVTIRESLKVAIDFLEN